MRASLAFTAVLAVDRRRLLAASLALLAGLGGCRLVAGYDPSTERDATLDGRQPDGGVDARRVDAVLVDLSGTDDANTPSPPRHLYLGDPGHLEGEAVATATLNNTDYVAIVGQLGGTLALKGCPPLGVGTNSTNKAAALLLFKRTNDALNCVWGQVFEVKGSDGTGLAAFRGVAIDTSRSQIAVVGDANGPIKLGGVELPNRGNTDIIFGVYDLSTGAHVASASWGSPKGDEGSGVALAEDGDPVVVGTIRGTATFDSSTLTPVPAGSAAAFVARFDLQAKHVGWVKLAGLDPVSDYGKGVAVLGGEAWVVGHLDGSATDNLGDVLVARHMLDNGNQRWLGRFGTSKSGELGTSVAAQGTTVLVGGYAYGQLDFFGTKLGPAFSGQPYGFLTALAPGDNLGGAPDLLAAQRITGGPGASQRVYAVGFDGLTPVACGEFSKSLNGTLTVQMAKASKEGFCLGYTLSNKVLTASWDRIFFAGGDETIRGAAVSGASNARRLIVAGPRTGTVGLPKTAGPAAGVWLSASHALSQGTINAVVADPSGTAIYVGGRLQTGYRDHAGAGGSEGFVARVELATGTPSWITWLSSKGDDVIEALALEGKHLYLAGSFGSGTAQLGGVTIDSSSTNPQQQIAIGVLARLSLLTDGGLDSSWSPKYFVSSTTSARARALVVDASKVYVAGTTSAGLSQPLQKSSAPIFLFAYDRNAEGIPNSWTGAGKHLGGIAKDSQGRPLLYGGHGGDGFVVLLDGALNERHVITLPGGAASIARDGVVVRAADTDGFGLVAIGTFDTSVTLGGTPHPAAPGMASSFVIEIDETSGTLRNSRKLEGDDLETLALTYLGVDRLTLVGSYRGDLEVPLISGTVKLPNVGAVAPLELVLDRQSFATIEARALPTDAPSGRDRAPRAALIANGQLMLVGEGSRALGSQPWIALYP